MKRRIDIGDGDLCPEDADHGRMWLLPSRRQFCPHQAHAFTGPCLYEYDGVTPCAASQPAPDARSQTPTTAPQTSLDWEGAAP